MKTALGELTRLSFRWISHRDSVLCGHDENSLPTSDVEHQPDGDENHIISDVTETVKAKSGKEEVKTHLIRLVRLLCWFLEF